MAAGHRLTFQITGTEIVECEGSRVANFVCEMTVPGMAPHRVPLRYSQLRKIHEELQSALPWAMPPFPSRKFDLFSNFHTVDPASLRARTEQLNAYYQTLFSNPAWVTCEKLHNLFGLPQEHRIAIIQGLL